MPALQTPQAPVEKLDGRALAAARRASLSRRARRIRRGVAGGALGVFVAAFLGLYVQLASGHDPGLASARHSAATASASSGAAGTSSSSSGGSSGGGEASGAGGEAAGSGSQSGEASSSSGESTGSGESSASGESSVTTRQS